MEFGMRGEIMKKAFTMLELVFVIVTIGILAVAIIPSTRTNPVQEAAVDLVSKIRYTQHLGMVDDKFDADNSTWMANRWQIVFSGTNNIEYSITHNNIDDGTVSTKTYAKNPLNKEDIKEISLNDKYNVTVTLTGGCNAQTNIVFDHLGRPMTGDISNDSTAYISGQLMTAPCIITLTNGSESVDINIAQETGYARIMS